MNTNSSKQQSSQAKEVLLLGAGFTTNNMGVWALASSAIKAAYRAIPGVRIRLLDYHTNPQDYSVKVGEDSVNVELVNIRFSKKFYLRNNIARLIITALLLRIVPLKQLRRRIISKNPVLSAIYDANFIGSIAGGDSFSDIYGVRRFFYVSLPQLLVLILRKPLILLPQTLGPFNRPMVKLVAKYIICKAQSVYARDQKSLQIGQSIIGGNSRNLSLCCDMAFVLEPALLKGVQLDQMQKLEKHRPLIGLNVSGLLYMGGYNRNNMFSLKCDYPSLIHEIIQFFVDRQLHVLLVPHVFGDASAAESDISAIEKVYTDRSEVMDVYLHKLESEFDHQEIKSVIGQCDFFLGSRMHACIAALSQGIPAIGLAYSRKFHGVFETIGVEHLVVDLQLMTIEGVISKIEKGFSSRNVDREKLSVNQKEINSQVLELFSDCS